MHGGRKRRVHLQALCAQALPLGSYRCHPGGPIPEEREQTRESANGLRTNELHQRIDAVRTYPGGDSSNWIRTAREVQVYSGLRTLHMYMRTREQGHLRTTRSRYLGEPRYSAATSPYYNLAILGPQRLVTVEYYAVRFTNRR